MADQKLLSRQNQRGLNRNYAVDYLFTKSKEEILMDKFFNSDNVVMRTLSKIFDIGWLTLIYLVFCIPIVTV